MKLNEEIIYDSLIQLALYDSKKYKDKMGYSTFYYNRFMIFFTIYNDKFGTKLSIHQFTNITDKIVYHIKIDNSFHDASIVNVGIHFIKYATNQIDVIREFIKLANGTSKELLSFLQEHIIRYCI
jgi:hypothetical protein